MHDRQRIARATVSAILRAVPTSRLTQRALDALSRALSQSGVRHSASRTSRTSLGLVFVDVVNFSSWTARNSDREALRLLDELHACIERCVSVGKGKVIKRLGDGFFLAFPSASQAVRAAVLIDRSVTAATRELNGVRVRIAVHAGHPLASGDDFIGHDVNVASRLLEHCAPGQVVVSQVAKESAERRLRTVRFRYSKRVKLRGVGQIYSVYVAESRAARGRRSA